jgi:hypothetical protein
MINRRCNARPERPWQGNAVSASPLLPAQFSNWMPPRIVARPRVAAPELGLHQDEIAAAIDRFLREYGS